MNHLTRLITFGLLCGLLFAACAPRTISDQPSPLPPNPTPLVPTESPLPPAATATVEPSITPALSAIQIALATSSAKQQIQTPTLPPAPGLIDVGGYKLYMECQGSGSPAIILEHGFSSKSWKTLHLKLLSDTSLVCFYRRPGVAPSEQAPNLPLTTRDHAQILHTLLQNAGIPAPYVLVGHSLGAYTLLMYTHLYPDEVVGLVCVECGPPQNVQDSLDLLGPEKADDSDALKQYRNETAMSLHLLYPDFPEKVDSIASEVQLLEVTSLGDVPFIVLVGAGFKESSWIQVPEEFFDGLTQLWIDNSKELAALSTAGQVILTSYNHMTILNAPEVIDAIQTVVAIAR
jgi:pimeloyl-ACP methyl ester carboxylesterase